MFSCLQEDESSIWLHHHGAQEGKRPLTPALLNMLSLQDSSTLLPYSLANPTTVSSCLPAHGKEGDSLGVGKHCLRITGLACGLAHLPDRPIE